MKICFCGNFRAPWCSEVHESLSLEELGHQVIRLQEDTTTNQQILAMVELEKPEVFFFVHTWGWGSMDVETLRKIHCPTVYYHLDLIRGIPDRENMVDSSWWYKCSFVFLPDGDPESIKFFKQHGINHFFSPPAVYSGGCYLAEPVEELKSDVVFIGARYEHYHPQWIYRKTLIEKLEQQYGSRFKVYEHSTQMREHKLNQLCASAKVSVGDSFCPGFNRVLYVSDRLFEHTGRGIASVFPRIKGIDQYLEEGKEILYYDYNNWVDLFNKIDWLLDHADERIAMRNAAMERVKREHTYKVRLQNVLNVVAGRKNIYETH